MKTHPVLTCVLALSLSGPAARADVVSDRNATLASIQQTSGQTQPGRARADGIFRETLVNAMTGIPERTAPVRPAEDVPPGADLDAAASQAAFTALSSLYPAQSASFDAQLATSLAGLAASDESVAAGRAWGRHVAETVLAEHDTEVFLNPYTFSEAKAPASGPTVPGVQAETASPGSYTFTTLAGSPGISGSADGIGNAARFAKPTSLAVDNLGNVYVADSGNHTIRKIALDGVVTTLAGLAGNPGSDDGPGSAARFNDPSGLAVDAAGNVYVADLRNHTIRKITPSGEVSTLAGSPGNPGMADGSGSDARFNRPLDVAVDPAGNMAILVADASGIRKLTPDGTVSTLDLTPSGFLHPLAVTVDGAGNVYVLNYEEGDLDIVFSSLYKFTRTAGGAYADSLVASGWTASLDGHSFSYSALSDPTAMAVDSAGNLLVVDGSGFIRRFTPSGEIQTPRVTPPHPFSSDLAVDGRGNVYLVSSYLNSHTVQIGVFDATALVMIKGPISQEATVGDTVTFTVEVAGEPTISYQWYLNRTALSGATSPTLTLSNVQLADGGTYTVTATNSTSSVTSYPALLSVKTPVVTPPPPPPPPPAGNSSSGGGGAPSGWFLGELSLLFAARRWRHFAPLNSDHP